MKPSTRKSGFALIATLSIMLLIVLLLVAMLSLANTSTRGQAQGKAQSEAQANAKLALMLAIGDLQKQMGPDQRISANADILSLDESGNDVAVENPHWTGVWDSWVAGDPADAPVNANYPSAASHHQTIGNQDDDSMRPEYVEKNLHFRKWLVSLLGSDIDSDIDTDDPQNTPISLALNGQRMPDYDPSNPTAVQLVGEGSLGSSADSADYVSARLIDVKDEGAITTGRFGWWVGDQSQKARIMDDSYAAQEADPNEPPLTSAEKIYRSQAPASTGTKMVTGLTTITDDTQLDKELASLASYQSLDLLSGLSGDVRPSKDNFHSITTNSLGVLADVREGGLKRDLSTILEQPIRLEDNGPEFMLYEFDDPRFPYRDNPNDERRANSRVPIQDLAAYYQLYDHEPTFDNGRREGVQYTSTALPNTLQIKVPDHDGGNKNRQFLIREYTSLYKRPVVTKVQFLVGVTAQSITQAERDWIQAVVDGTKPPGGSIAWQPNVKPIRDSDTLKLKLGVQTMVTLWNPNNLPLVMEAKQILRYNVPPFGIKFRKYRAGGNDYQSLWMNLGYASNIGGGASAGSAGGNLLDLRLANDTIIFEPGEVKVFSIPDTAAAYLTDDGDNERNTLEITQNMDVVNEWDPFGVFLMRNSAPIGPYANQSPEVHFLNNNGQRAQTLVLSPSDSISLSVDSESATTALNRLDGRNGSRFAAIIGAGFGLYIFDEGYKSGHWSTWADAMRHDILLSRHGMKGTDRAALGGFYRELMLPGFPGGKAPIEFDNETNAISGQQLKLAGENGEIIGLMDFSLSIGSETSSSASGGFGGGRRITSRPFLHSATPALPFISEADKASLYDYGMDWQISKINTVEDSIMQAKPGTGNGYYGGGYTIENGTTHVIQNEIPVLPPISIASLSHAYLGGFSMAKAIPVGEDPDNDTYWFKSRPANSPSGVTYQRVTASGQNGLAPQIGQATGNSYAHPNIPANKAFVTKARLFDLDEGSFDIPFVDHSYLANKALWDEFFFSSIAPQPSKVLLFGSPDDRSAKQVADDFFFNDLPLPNRRINPYKGSLSQAKLDALFTEADTYTDGLADKLAANLMVNGAFNVNSTSVDAWKVFLSSLKGKPVAYLNGGVTPQEAVTEGTTFSPGTLANAAPIKTADITSPNLPTDQWKAGRELTDEDIEQLAVAIVKQVKIRGPFLSLSEFVNRRLEGSSPAAAGDRSVKGALQAALDDENVAINANFRTAGRMLDTETADIGFDFPLAATGPIAYGSAPYVDQADVLKHFSAQLTPRGDTFVIRTYGDSIDASGKIVARAWCEAVIQRIPDYVDASSGTGDEAYKKQSDLISETNKTFGRQFKIISFRWLNSNEV